MHQHMQDYWTIGIISSICAAPLSITDGRNSDQMFEESHPLVSSRGVE